MHELRLWGGLDWTKSGPRPWLTALGLLRAPPIEMRWDLAHSPGMMPKSNLSNFLVIISDEHRKDAMGCAGHPLVRTPHLDALAARGALFGNAYTPSPICVPARACIATGDYVHKTGHWDSATPYDGRIRSWMHHLRDQGVETVSIGRLHFRSSEDDNGFSKEIVPMHVAGGVGWTVGLLRDPPPAYTAAAELAADVGVGDSTYTEYDRAITAAAEAWLGERAGADASWAAFISLVSPHYPLTCPKAFHDLYDPSDVDLPSVMKSALAPRIANCRTLRISSTMNVTSTNRKPAQQRRRITG